MISTRTVISVQTAVSNTLIALISTRTVISIQTAVINTLIALTSTLTAITTPIAVANAQIVRFVNRRKKARFGSLLPVFRSVSATEMQSLSNTRFCTMN